MPKKAFVKTQLRIPSELHERLLAAAAASGRSMNAEIVYRLDDRLSVSAELKELVETAEVVLDVGNARLVAEKTRGDLASFFFKHAIDSTMDTAARESLGKIADGLFPNITSDRELGNKLLKEFSDAQARYAEKSAAARGLGLARKKPKDESSAQPEPKGPNEESS